MKFRKFHLILLSLLSGVILSLAWPERGFPALLFIGMVPMLLVEDYIARHPEKFIKFSLLFYAYPGFLLWNLLTTWWIANSTLVGAVMAIVLNSLFMSIIFQAFHFTRKKLRSSLAGYIALVSYWIAFEYLHLNWDLNWPWLNLGNGFADYYKWVQWYEYTGAFGGTLWVLVANIMGFQLLKYLRFTIYDLQVTNDELRMTNDQLPITNYQLPTGAKRSPAEPITNFFRHASRVTPSRPVTQSPCHPVTLSPCYLVTLLLLSLWLALPIISSYIIYNRYEEKKSPVNFVVVQPNIDPYSEQYSLPPAEVISRIMELALPKTDSNTNFLVAPESAIQESMWENDLSSFASIRFLKQAIAPYPNLNMLVGGSTFYQLAPGEPRQRWFRKFTDTDNAYYAYNAAIMINSRDSLQLYHKSKLTPGVEILPSFRGFKWLEKFAIDLGGTVGSLGMDSVRRVYTTVGTVKVGPAICYESIFGEFFGEFVRNGAQIMIIITNDGWWGNTAGHRQHFSFAHLRAIETRRSIARSANTGISAFIDQRGDAQQATAYWVPAVIKGTLNANDKITFYVEHGDYLARFFSYLAGVLILAAVGRAFFKGNRVTR